MQANQHEVTSHRPRALERRSATRCVIEQDLRYRVIGSSEQEICTAKTVNMSINGVLFSADSVPALGRRLALQVRWPGRSDEQPEFDLVRLGRVVRATGTSAAVVYETFDLRRVLERRSATRYVIERDLHYRVIGSSNQEICTAKTVNMSIDGVLFSAEAVPALGRRLALQVRWRGQSGPHQGFDLVILGRVVRAAGTSAAVVYQTFDFRTPESEPLSAADLHRIIQEAGRQ